MRGGCGDGVGMPILPPKISYRIRAKYIRGGGILFFYYLFYIYLFKGPMFFFSTRVPPFLPPLPFCLRKHWVCRGEESHPPIIPPVEVLT